MNELKGNTITEKLEDAQKIVIGMYDGWMEYNRDDFNLAVQYIIRHVDMMKVNDYRPKPKSKWIKFRSTSLPLKAKGSPVFIKTNDGKTDLVYLCKKDFTFVSIDHKRIYLTGDVNKWALVTAPEED